MESEDTELMINDLRNNWGLFEKNRVIPAYYYILAGIQYYKDAEECSRQIISEFNQTAEFHKQMLNNSIKPINPGDAIFLPDIMIAGRRQDGAEFIRVQKNNYFHYLRVAYDLLIFAVNEGFLRDRITDPNPSVKKIKDKIKQIPASRHGTDHYSQNQFAYNTRKWLSSVMEKSGTQEQSLLYYIIDFDNRIKHEYPLSLTYHYHFRTLIDTPVYTTTIPAFTKNNRIHQKIDFVKSIPEFNLFMKQAIRQFINAFISDQKASSPFKYSYNGVTLQSKDQENVTPIVCTDSPTHEAPERIYVLGSARTKEEMNKLREHPELLNRICLIIDENTPVYYDQVSIDKKGSIRFINNNIIDLSIPKYNLYIDCEKLDLETK